MKLLGSSGIANFWNVLPRYSQLTPNITVVRRDGFVIPTVDGTRNIRLGIDNNYS